MLWRGHNLYVSKFFTGLLFLLEVASLSQNEIVHLTISAEDREFRTTYGQDYMILNEGMPVNLTCAVKVSDYKKKTLRDLSEVSDSASASYEIHWYLPSRNLQEHYKLNEEFNKKTLIIQETRLSFSGVYQCRATNRNSEGRFPPTLLKDVTVKVLPNAEGRTPTCGQHFFQCLNNPHHCIAKRFTCDGVPDCFDASDESVDVCGEDDPCTDKIRCEDHRCIDSSLCCDPTIDPTCPVVLDCCFAVLKSGRQFYKLGIERRNSQDLKLLHSTIYTVVGCVAAFITIMLLLTLAVCRLHAKRGLFWRFGMPRGSRQLQRGASRPHPPVTLHDLDVYFASLRRVESTHSLAAGHHGITYNINNGVQIVGGPVLPPPYSAAASGHEHSDPPPPYQAAVERPVVADQDPDIQDPLLVGDGEEDNNNGDINGNSDMVDHNLVHQREVEQQQEQHRRALRAVANVDIHPAPHEPSLRGASGPVSPAVYTRASSVHASPVWSNRLGLSRHGSEIMTAAQQGSSRINYLETDSSSSDSD